MSNAVLDRSSGEKTADAANCPICGCPQGQCPRQTHVFKVDNLDCANCAAKMEERIARLPDVDEVTLTYATKQLKVTCPHPEQMMPLFQKECASVEADAVVRERGASSNTAHGSDAASASGIATAQGGLNATKASEAGDHEASTRRRNLVCIVVSAALLAAGIVCEHLGAPMSVALAIYVIAYFIAGGKVLLRAAHNIRHGQVFDESFLMSIATIGAFAVQQFPEAVGVMLFYRIGESFEERAVNRSRSQIEGAVDMRPETVNRLVAYHVDQVEMDASGQVLSETAHARDVEVIPAGEIEVGEYVLVRPGERIPLDGTLVEGSTSVDTSPVTGEALPVVIREGEQVMSGCVNVDGLIVLRVDKPLSESMVTRILDAVENAAASKPHIQRLITRFARIYTPVVIAIAVFTAVIPSLLTGNWMQWIYTACTFLVISCPCAIVLSVPLAYFAGIGAASKLGILFKGGNSIEAMRDVRAVVMDKTGTITCGTFSVRAINAVQGFTSDEVLVAAASAEQASTHPIAASIVAATHERGLSPVDIIDVHETAGMGVEARLAMTRGEFEVVCGTRMLLEEHGISVSDEFLDGGGVLVAVDGEFAGSIDISDAPKPDSREAISRLKAAGIHPVMLTGDASEAAEEVATEVGIDDVHARLLPEQKLEKLQDVRKHYGSSMFVGDGINDAPVLAGADVGAAMGSGADAAIEAADVVFMNSTLEAVPQSLHIARVVSVIALQNIVFALVVKVAVMVFGFVGLASMWAAVFADVGVALLCILNSIRILHKSF